MLSVLPAMPGRPEAGPPRRKIRVGIAQLNPVLGDVTRNLNLHSEWIGRAREQRVDLLVFPELGLTGYYLRDLVPEVAMPLSSPQLAKLTDQSRGIDLLVSFVEERPDYSYQVAAAYLRRGAIAHVHRKLYLPTYGMFDEERYLARGSKLRVFQTDLGPAGILVCEDMWHPSCAYVYAQGGAQLLLGVASSPGREVRGDRLGTAEAYALITGCYAMLFSCYVVFANRVGFEDGVNFWGGSCVVDPFGKVVAAAPEFEETLLVAELDPSAVKRARQALPLLEDERVEVLLAELKAVQDARAHDQY